MLHWLKNLPNLSFRKIQTPSLGIQNMDLPIKRVEYLKDGKWVWTGNKNAAGTKCLASETKKGPFYLVEIICDKSSRAVSYFLQFYLNA